tara:strand:- start:5082 stop:5360 length:279 start_codon:yes stop_codon:yes gene_type:complete
VEKMLCKSPDFSRFKKYTLLAGAYVKSVRTRIAQVLFWLCDFRMLASQKEAFKAFFIDFQELASWLQYLGKIRHTMMKALWNRVSGKKANIR